MCIPKVGICYRCSNGMPATNCKTAWQYNIVALNLTYVLWQKRGICNDKYTQEVTMNIQVKMLFAFKLLFDKGSLFFIPSPPPKSKNVAQHLHIQRVQKLTKNLHIILPFYSRKYYYFKSERKLSWHVNLMRLCISFVGMKPKGQFIVWHP